MGCLPIAPEPLYIPAVRTVVSSSQGRLLLSRSSAIERFDARPSLYLGLLPGTDRRAVALLCSSLLAAAFTPVRTPHEIT